jgi:hypothetical protein
MDRFLCSVSARDRGEPVFGTASRVDRWVLVESSGPWGSRALPQTRGVDDTLLLTLQQRARAVHARLLLARRPSRSTSHGVRDVVVADSRPGHERLLRREVTNDHELAGLALPFDDDTDGWRPMPALVGVCTQGSHDACCAVMGRPVASALAASHPDICYEISHIGGDRFAANLLVLPGGHYLGHLPPELASEAVDRLLAGLVPGPYYRGRSSYSMPVQAAQSFARQALGIDTLDALAPLHTDLVGPRRWRVLLAPPDGAPTAASEGLAVEVEQDMTAPPVQLTCSATEEHPPPVWRLRELTGAG